MSQRFIQRFSTSGTEQEAIDNQLLGKPYIAFIEDGQYIDWNTLSPTPPLSAQPLTFEIISGGTITWKKEGSIIYPAPTRTIEYSINDGPWVAITSTTDGVSFSVQDGDIVRFKGNSTSYMGGLGAAGNRLIVNGVFKLYGNICSLMTDNYTETSPNDFAIAKMFKENTGLTEVTEIALGNNMLSHSVAYSFADLFNGCSNLNYVKCLLEYSVQGLGSYFRRWLTNTAAEGTFVKNQNMDWVDGEIPTGWTVVDADI